ncbi:MAG: hypothetical protein D6707_00950, partial [Bacteroidetes bacterium]
MKKLLFFLVAFLWYVSAFSQIDEGINYQAVVRDSDGQIIKNKGVSVWVSVIKDTPTGTVEGQEEHQV